jgi:glycosyltransferase involved in cell wall biosynthesis
MADLIVVPAYNEEGSLGVVLAELALVLPSCDVVVVDDGSSDRTRLEAQAMGVVVLSLPYNLGVGAAMRTGYQYAVRHGYRAVVQVDADGQHDPTGVPALLAGLEHANIVIGARFAAGGYRVRGPRRWAMRLLARVVSRVAGHRLTDVTSGFRAVDARALGLFASSYPADYLGDTVEALVLAARAGLVVDQVDVHMRCRQGGCPSQSVLRATLYLLRAVLALGLGLIRGRSDSGSDILCTDTAASRPVEAR